MTNGMHHKQNGAILIVVGLTLAVLLGLAGLVIDLGGLFVAKTEMQSAVDSCALAAAQELDGNADALIRAANAGRTSGNVNKVHYQKTSANIAAADITFSDTLGGVYSATFTPVKNARYVRCRQSTGSIANLLITLVGGPSSSAVTATAIATLGPGQALCPLPVGLLPKSGGTSPRYGYQVGEWVSLLFDSATGGEWGWYNLDGTTNANETRAEVLNGYCNSKIGDPVGTMGKEMTVGDEWNSRFGIYKQNHDKDAMPPDRTGYSYTTNNWKNVSPQNAYKGTPASGSHATAENFQIKRSSFANYANTGTKVDDGDSITNLNMKGGYKVLATSGSGGQHASYNQNRRVIMIPVVASNKIIDYVCMLMLHPMSSPTSNVMLEFLGNPKVDNIPECTISGLPGVGSGPLVPALVR